MNFLVNRKVTENKTEDFHHCEWRKSYFCLNTKTMENDESIGKTYCSIRSLLQVSSKQQLQGSIFIPTLLQHRIQVLYWVGPDGCVSSYELPATQAENQAILGLLHSGFFHGLGNNPQEGSGLLIAGYQEKSSAHHQCETASEH